MISLQLITKNDLREAAKLRRRRQLEVERKKRIFNERSRLFGRDVDGMNHQITEKAKQEQIDKEIKKANDNDITRLESMLYQNYLKEKREKRNIALKINNYNCMYQRKEDAREFDLNDPNMLRKMRPVRIGDDDPRLGISSAQIFEGEDVDYENRRHRQGQQQRSWLYQQMKERETADNKRRRAQVEFQKSLLQKDQKLCDSVGMDILTQHRKDLAFHCFNTSLATEKKDAQILARKENSEDEEVHVRNVLNSDMLNEKRKADLTKKKSQSYRGLTHEQLMDIRKEQCGQRQVYNQNKVGRKEEELKWDVYYRHMDDRMNNYINKEEENKKKLILDNYYFNKKLAEEQRARNQQSKINSRNVISDEFFANFNRGTR